MKLDSSVQYVKGVGPRLAEVLAKKDVHTVSDLLQWFPRSYDDRRRASSIADLQVGETATFEAEVRDYRRIPLGRTKRFIHEVIFSDDSGRISAKWFHAPHKKYFEEFKAQARVRVTGAVRAYRFTKELHHPEVTFIGETADEEPQRSSIIPVYSETEGLNQRSIRKIIDAALQGAGPLMAETLPDWILSSLKLPALAAALESVHHPTEDFSVEDWRRMQTPFHHRIIFEEFFWLELTLARARAGLARDKALSMKSVSGLSDKLREAFGFRFTAGQEKALVEITRDLMKGAPMHRLVQGDVGSGKTAVAFMAASLVMANGCQTALMVPTEILAEQHYIKARALFEPLGVKVVLLTSGQKRSTSAREAVASGEAQLIVGTQALIQESVTFDRLALIIIDEQHRFGVKQRAELLAKGKMGFVPHFLVMTATPIPRTLAMTVYGDLDVSTIRELPAGRQPITTKFVFENKRAAVHQFIRQQLDQGRQTYIVYPLVEETEKLDLKNATDQAGILADELKPFKVGLLHGRMKTEEKESLMRQFKDNQIQVLVTTTVVEVGVDVPNATVMMVEHAERFGLAQLHQLRGRVGRGSHKSYCILMASYALGPEARRRLEVMAETQDGFCLAEEDLKIRGPGEFLGTRQSGLPGFKMADITRDIDWLQKARDCAFETLLSDSQLQDPKNIRLRQAFEGAQKPRLLWAQIG